MPYPNFHAARMRNPNDFSKIVVLQTLPNGIMIYGGTLRSEPQGKSKVQAYRFPKAKFTVIEAKKWLSDHKLKPIMFEPASGKQEICDILDEQFIKMFKSIDTNNKDLLKAYFRELFINRSHLKFENNLSMEFINIAREVLPELLTSKIRTHCAYDVIEGNTNKVKSYDIAENNMPYLLRQSNETEIVGMVRLSNCTKKDGKFEYDVYDYIPFTHEVKSRKSDCKFDLERKQMFSVAYRSWESWNQPDTDDEYIREIDLNKMVKQVAEDGIDVNLEHDSRTTIRKSDARVIEFYQARTSWIEEGLEVRKGDVVATTQFYDTPRGKQLWSDLKNGDYTTYSIEGDKNVGWERIKENE